MCNVIKLNYISGYHVILFKCEWFDTNPKKKRIQQDFHLTSISVRNTWYENDPFVLATQASQVFYLDDYKLGSDWKIAQKVQHRHIWDVPKKDDVGDLADGTGDEAYQEEVSSNVQLEVQEDDGIVPLVRVDDDLPEEIITSPDFNANGDDNDHIPYDDDSGEEDDTLEEYCSDDEKSQYSDDDSD